MTMNVEDRTGFPVTSAKDLLRRYAKGEYVFREVNLAGANLSQSRLNGIDLSGAILNGINFEGASLARANLSGAHLGGAYLSDADLQGADLRGADLFGAFLNGSHLNGAYLADSNMSVTYLERADLRGAHLDGAKNLPVSSHDVVTELLLREAGKNYRKRQIAGLTFVSRDWCWATFSRIALENWPLDLRLWVTQTLVRAGEQFERQLRETPFLTKDEQAKVDADNQEYK